MANKGLINITIDNPITASLRKLPREVQEAIEGVVEETSERLFRRIKDDTPRDRGTLAGNWKKDNQGDQVVMTNKTPYVNVAEFGGWPVVAIRKKKSAAKKKRKKATAKKKVAKKKKKKVTIRRRTGPGFIRGNARLGGYGPGNRTAKAPGGSPAVTSNVSRQAPSGMARQNLERIQPRFVFDLEEAVDEAFEKIAEPQ